MSVDSESDVSGPVATIKGPGEIVGNPRYLLADQRDERMRRDRARHRLREADAIDGERGARRHARHVGGRA